MKKKAKKKRATKLVRRDPGTGKFLPGTAPGPGSGTMKRTAALRRAVLDSFTPAELRAVFLKLHKLAVRGDVDAARLFLNYAIGKPRQADADAEDNALGVALDCVTLSGCAESQRSVLAALSEGRVSPDDAVKASAIIESARRAIESVELEQRITQLESAAEARDR